jgi:hypothetical protein
MPEDAERPSGSRSTIVLFALGLIWLAAYLWAAHASIVGAGDDEVIAVFDAALALPGVVAATMLAGATASVTALGWLRPRLSRTGGWAVSGTALGAGLVIGLLAGGLILLGYGHRSSIMVLAWAVVAAGAVGGIVGSARPRDMTSAGLAATLAAFFVGFLLNYKQDTLIDLFGGGTSAQSRADALRPLTLTESLVAGLLAGIVAFLYLRRTRAVPHFIAYPADGAAPGIILLLAEAVTRLGGSQLFGAAGNSSVIDQTAVEYSSGSRLNHGLIVLFAGAFVAMIAYGVTLRPATAGPAGSAGRPAGPGAGRRAPGDAGTTGDRASGMNDRGPGSKDRPRTDDRATGERRTPATAEISPGTGAENVEA